MKRRKLLQSELRVGMKVIGGNDVSSCWKLDGEIIPFIIRYIKSSGETSQQSLDGQHINTCSCSDRDKLYAWRSGIQDLFKGDEIFNKKQEQTITILARIENLVAYANGAIIIWNTIANLKESGYELVKNEPVITLTTEEVLAQLSELKGQTVTIKD